MDAILETEPDLVTVPETEAFDHKVYPHICELSLLLGYGNGKDLMHRIALDVKKSEDYSVLLTNALPSAIPFSENVMSMLEVPVNRWEVNRTGPTSLSIRRHPYYHYLDPGQFLPEEERAHMYAIQIEGIDLGVFAPREKTPARAQVSKTPKQQKSRF